LTGDDTFQPLAAGYPIGMRFQSALVVRHADGKPMELGHVIEADGRWRLLAFADRDEARLGAFLQFLETSPQSPLLCHTTGDADPDSVIDLRAIYQRALTDIPEDQVCGLLRPRKGRFGLIDYEKVFCAAPAPDIFDMRGIDRHNGCAMIVRPDQYVADIIPLDGRDRLTEFFSGIFL
jgi:phenol 2-monooxygenase